MTRKILIYVFFAATAAVFVLIAFHIWSGSVVIDSSQMDLYTSTWKQHHEPEEVPLPPASERYMCYVCDCRAGVNKVWYGVRFGKPAYGQGSHTKKEYIYVCETCSPPFNIKMGRGQHKGDVKVVDVSQSRKTLWYTLLSLAYIGGTVGVVVVKASDSGIIGEKEFVGVLAATTLLAVVMGVLGTNMHGHMRTVFEASAKSAPSTAPSQRDRSSAAGDVVGAESTATETQGHEDLDKVPPDKVSDQGNETGSRDRLAVGGADVFTMGSETQPSLGEKGAIVLAKCQFAVEQGQIIGATGNALLTPCYVRREVDQSRTCLMIPSPVVSLIETTEKLPFDSISDFDGESQVSRIRPDGEVAFAVTNPESLEGHAGKLVTVIQFMGNETKAPLFGREARASVKVLDMASARDRQTARSALRDEKMMQNPDGTGGTQQPAAAHAQGAPIRKLHLKIEQDFGTAGPVDLPVEHTLRVMLEGIGVEIAAAVPEAEATLAVSVRGRAIEQDPGRWTAAELDVGVTLTGPDGASIAARKCSKRFPEDEHAKLPETIVQQADQPSGAPFEIAFHAVMDDLREWVCEVWGCPNWQVLTALVLDAGDTRRAEWLKQLLKLEGMAIDAAFAASDGRTRLAAIAARRAMGETTYLVRHAVDDPDPRVRVAAAHALVEIGGRSPLLAIMSASDPRVVEVAESALTKIPEKTSRDPSSDIPAEKISFCVIGQPEIGPKDTMDLRSAMTNSLAAAGYRISATPKTVDVIVDVVLHRTPTSGICDLHFWTAPRWTLECAVRVDSVPDAVRTCLEALVAKRRANGMIAVSIKTSKGRARFQKLRRGRNGPFAFVDCLVKDDANDEASFVNDVVQGCSIQYNVYRSLKDSGWDIVRNREQAQLGVSLFLHRRILPNHYAGSHNAFAIKGRLSVKQLAPERRPIFSDDISAEPPWIYSGTLAGLRSAAAGAWKKKCVDFPTTAEFQKSLIEARERIERLPRRQLQAMDLREPVGNPVSKSAREMRTWTDVSGRFQVEAQFDGLIMEQVILKKADGERIRVPLDRLGKKDRDWVQDRKQ